MLQNTADQQNAVERMHTPMEGMPDPRDTVGCGFCWSGWLEERWLDYIYLFELLFEREVNTSVFIKMQGEDFLLKTNTCNFLHSYFY